MCGAVTHGKYVIVAGDVGAAGNVIGVLGETSGHSVWTLQDTHCWLCDSLGGKRKEKSRRRTLETLGLDSRGHRLKKKRGKGQGHSIEKQLHLSF